MRCISRQILIAAAILTLFAGGVAPKDKSSEEEEKHSAESLAKKLSAAGLKKVVVADFLEGGTQRTAQGVYLAARFSKALFQHAKTFDVLDRQLLFALLQKENIAPADLGKPEIVRHVGAALGVDALVVGRIDSVATSDKTKVGILLLSMTVERELAGEKYQVVHTPSFASYFPPTSDPAGTQFYFPGFDGVSSPVCGKCPDPNYTDEERRRHFQGIVVFSVLVTPEGKLAELRLLRSAGNDLDEEAAAALKAWKLKPAQGPSGQPVPVRMAVEITFRLFP
jgi:TonB family protein